MSSKLLKKEANKRIATVDRNVGVVSCSLLPFSWLVNHDCFATSALMSRLLAMVQYYALPFWNAVPSSYYDELYVLFLQLSLSELHC